LLRECRKCCSGDPDSSEGFNTKDGLPNSGILGDCGVVPEYGGRMPLTRSGESANSGCLTGVSITTIASLGESKKDGVIARIATYGRMRCVVGCAFRAMLSTRILHVVGRVVQCLLGPSATPQPAHVTCTHFRIQTSEPFFVPSTVIQSFTYSASYKIAEAQLQRHSLFIAALDCSEQPESWAMTSGCAHLHS
jgi:hypothetical protein